MANNQPLEGLGDEYFEQIMPVPGYNSGEDDHFGGYVGSGSGGDHVPSSIFMGLGTGDGSGHCGVNVGLGGFRGGMGLGFNLDHYSSFSVLGDGVNVASSSSRLYENESLYLTNLFPAFSQQQSQSIRAPPPSIHVPQSHWAPGPAQTMSHPPAIQPRVRARRGQATDPHSIAERLRRKRIAELMKALQVLVPSCNKTDGAAMLDEIADYFKFLRLQVKVLSMSRMGGAGAVAQLVADVPPTSIEGDGVEGAQPVWDRLSNDGTEQQVARLMEQDIGAAMQFLQSKELCIMPVSLASAIFRSQPPPPDPASMVIPKTNPPP